MDLAACGTITARCHSGRVRAPEDNAILRFPVTYRGQMLEVEIGLEKVEYTLREGESLVLRHDDRSHCRSIAPQQAPAPAALRAIAELKFPGAASALAVSTERNICVRSRSSAAGQCFRSCRRTVPTGRSQLLLTGRTAVGFSRVSRISSVSLRAIELVRGTTDSGSDFTLHWHGAERQTIVLAPA